MRSGIGGGADHLPWLQPLWLGSLQIQHTWAKVQLDRQGLSWFQFQQMGFPSSFFKCAPAGKFGCSVWSSRSCRRPWTSTCRS